MSSISSFPTNFIEQVSSFKTYLCNLDGWNYIYSIALHIPRHNFEQVRIGFGHDYFLQHSDVADGHNVLANNIKIKRIV